MAKDDQSQIKKVADSAIILLTSRLSGPLLLAVCSWMLHTVNDLQVNFASLNAGISATVAGINTHIDSVEHRINSLEAGYVEGNGSGRRSN